MSNIMMGLLAETFIHSGIGRTEGAIDLPVAREAATDYPYIPGSSLKGALRDYARGHWLDDPKCNEDKVRKCFGHEGQEHAGGVLVSDARLLLLPVRSLTGSYKWATCPLLIERLRRDCARTDIDLELPEPRDLAEPEKSKVIGQIDDTLYLEERSFKHGGVLPDRLVDALKKLVKHEETRGRLNKQLIILNNQDFNWFARYALAIQARNVLEKDTKKSKNLWYEESLPPDTLMYNLLGERCDDSGLGDLKKLLSDQPYLQTGGNETVGHGWFAVSLRKQGG